MHTLFHGWRRKAGVVTLVMALALAGLWIRSCLPVNEFGGMSIGLVNFNSYEVSLETATYHYILYLDDGLKWTVWNDVIDSPELEWHAPYWTLVLPLTLLSAYLILWKPRKRG